MVIVVIGPDGAGKSTVGRALAADLGWLFVDDDDHRPARVPHDRSAGIRDDGSDDGRLRELREIIERVMARREHMVLACIAVTAADREALQAGLRPVRFVCLKVPRAELEDRLRRRQGHVMDAARLHRQLMELEDPGEQTLVLDGTKEPDILVPMIRRELGL